MAPSGNLACRPSVRDCRRASSTSATLSAAAVLAASLGSLLAFRPGPLASHMLLHTVLMSTAAPLCAIGLVWRFRSAASVWRPAPLWWATGLQIAVLWAWHVPVLHAAAHASAGIRALMWASLFSAAAGFWAAILLTPRRQLWHAMLALLITGKLVCLLGALLVFAPRELYAMHGMAHHAAPALDDQQLAGLLMLAACPFAYVLAGIVLAVQMIGGLTGPQPRAYGGPVAP